jgi:PEP-CTERM motif
MKGMFMSRAINFRNAVLSAAAVVVLGMAAASARADQVFLVNTTIGGTGPVNAQATFHQSGANLLQITLQNFQATGNIGQAISGIQFQICDAAGNVLNITGSITTQNNAEINVDGSGNVSSLGTVQSYWGLSSAGPSFSMSALGFARPGGNPPDELIIGPLNSPNGSIAGNDPHNPLINQQGVFSLTLSQNLPPGFQICNVVFLFGTGPDSVPGTPSAVPEPASMFLLGTGLVGIAVGVRRRRARMQRAKA